MRFVEEHRRRSGQLPVFQDFENGGFAKEVVKDAVREKLIIELYVTLTSGSVVKGFKVREQDE